MFFAFTALAIAALSQIVQANPLHVAPVTTAVHPISAELVTTAANFPLRELGSFVGQPNVTLSSQSGLRIDTTQAVFPATLLLCPALNCAGCSGFDLSTLPIDECLFTTAFNSMAISQLSNQGLPFAVDVSNNVNCLGLIQIPVVNECFNVATGGPFTAFALVQ